MNKFPLIIVLLIIGSFLMFGCTSSPSVAISEPTMITVVDINGFTHNIKLSDLNDVSVVGLVVGNVLSWNGTKWVPTDVNITPGGTDTNWQTSWAVFDLNMKYYFVQKADVNLWASQLDVNMQIDSNKWTLTKVDGNALYALKSDVNKWINSYQVDSNKWTLTKLDANGFYVLKTDLNSDINAVIALYNFYSRSDINASFLSKIDANGFYAFKTDINKTPVNTPLVAKNWFTSYNSATGVFGTSQIYFTDLNIVPAITCPAGTYVYGLLTGGVYCSTPLDTNWQTSWAVFDANMKATYLTTYVDTNWVTSWSVFDANMKATYSRSDTNWQTSWGILDANLKATYLTSYTDTNWVTAWATFDSNMKSTYRLYSTDLNTTGRIQVDKNLLVGPKGYMYDDGNAIVIGRAA